MKTRIVCLLVLVSTLFFLLPYTLHAEDAYTQDSLLVYVGTASYSGQVSKSILAFRFNPKTAELSPLGVAGEADNEQRATRCVG
jgi:hypothetical protein